MEQEKTLIRLGVPPTRYVFLEERGLSANQLKLFVGLQYAASKLPDIEEGDDTNIFTLPEFADPKNGEEPPRWKKLVVTNWNEFLTTIGFETDHPHRIKEDLKRLTKVEIPPYKIMIDGEQYTVTTRGSSIIRTKEITHDKSGRVREFSVMVGGYTPILKGWWMAISPAFLFHGGISITAWRFIILLGGTIRGEYTRIKDYLKTHWGGFNYWTVAMGMEDLERRMGISQYSNARKAEVWKEIYNLLGVEGVELAEMAHFPLKRMKAYGLQPFIEEQAISWQEARGLHDARLRGYGDAYRKYKTQRDALIRKTRDHPDAIAFSITRKMLNQWLPIATGRKDV